MRRSAAYTADEWWFVSPPREQGTNRLAGTRPEGILRAWHDLASSPPLVGGVTGRLPEGWDGHAAERIADVLAQRLGSLP